MDSAISTAARALSVGAPLEALKLVALRDDAPALALRGIAMAQLGELSFARKLLRRAAAAFGAGEPLARARTMVALSEVALALRDLTGAERGLSEAVCLLSERGDVANAALARLVQVRRLSLLGDVESAMSVLAQLALTHAPAKIVALAGLTAADLAMKQMDSTRAFAALQQARTAALQARIPALLAEVEKAERQLHAPVARLRTEGHEQPLTLRDLPTFLSSGRLVVDACRRALRLGDQVRSLVSRPVLLELLVMLAEHAPSDVPRDALITRVFGARRVNDSHRVRLRVELGRLRKLIAGLAELRATKTGFVLLPENALPVAVLLPPSEGEASALLSLLCSGEAWATSALAVALGKSQRAVQRALTELEAAGKVRASGKGPARRWALTPSAGIATTMLLVAPGTLG